LSDKDTHAHTHAQHKMPHEMLACHNPQDKVDADYPKKLDTQNDSLCGMVLPTRVAVVGALV